MIGCLCRLGQMRRLVVDEWNVIRGNCVNRGHGGKQKAGELALTRTVWTPFRQL